MTEKIKSIILSPQTLIPSGVFFALMMPLLVMTWTFAAQFTLFSRKLEDIENFTKQDAWTVNMESFAWAQVKIDNPNFNIPNAKLIHSEYICSK